MSKTLLFSLTIPFIAGCTTQPKTIDNLPPASTYSKLAGSVWEMVTDLTTNPYIEFRANGHLGGFTGCNRISGVYSETSATDNGRHIFELGEVITTEMACSQGMDEERKFLDALGKLRSFEFTGQAQMNLFQDDGTQILSLSRQTD